MRSEADIQFHTKLLIVPLLCYSMEINFSFINTLLRMLFVKYFVPSGSQPFVEFTNFYPGGIMYFSKLKSRTSIITISNIV